MLYDSEDIREYIAEYKSKYVSTHVLHLNFLKEYE